jgi:small subunit ribosomal protein S6
MPLYETVFITRQDLIAEDVDNLTDKLSKIITDAKGKIVATEYWGLRNLAYKIKKNDRGHYVLLAIDADFAAVAEMNRVMSFNEDIIRKSTFKVDEFSDKPSALALAANAKDYKAGKVQNNNIDTSKFDQVIDQINFEAQ